MTTYSFIDESGETRLVGTISPAPGGGSQAWTELFNSDDLANLSGQTTNGGTWVLAGHVISQTDTTDDDDTLKTLTFNLAAILTPAALAGLTGIAVTVECRADMAPGANFYEVLGLQGGGVSLGLISNVSDIVVYEDGGLTPVPVGTWSAQSYATIAAPMSVLAGGVTMNDGGGPGGVPNVTGLESSSNTPHAALVATVGQLRYAGTDVALGTQNGKGSFRKFRILGLYGLPAIPA